MIEFKRFSKSDWMGFSGAEKLSDGSDPFIGEIEIDMSNTIGRTIQGQILVTDTGVDIYAFEEEGKVIEYWFKLPHDKQTRSGTILLILESKTTEEQLNSLGFTVELS